MEPGFTGFNMDDEYEGGHLDENGFFRFTKERNQKKRFTKDEQIYGVFKEDMEEKQDFFEKYQSNIDKSLKSSLSNIKSNYGSFRRSGQLVHDSKSTVQVKFSNKEDQKRYVSSIKEQNKSNKKVEKQNEKQKQKKNVRFSDQDQIIEYDSQVSNKKRKSNNLLQDLEEELANDFEEQQEEIEGLQDEDKSNNEEVKTDYFKTKFTNSVRTYTAPSQKRKLDDEAAANAHQLPEAEQENELSDSSNEEQEGDDEEEEEENDLDKEEDEQEEEDDDEINHAKKVVREKVFNIDELRKERIKQFQRGGSIMSIFGLPEKFGNKGKHNQQQQNKKKVISEDNEFCFKNVQQEKQMKKDYGKGFELLKKIGYKVGEGLGRNNQGINKPVEAVFKTQMTQQDFPWDNKQQKQQNIADYGIHEGVGIFNPFNSELYQEEADEDKYEAVQVEKRFSKYKKDRGRMGGRYFSFKDEVDQSGNDSNSKNKQYGNQNIVNYRLKPDEVLKTISQSSHSKVIDMRGPVSTSYENDKLNQNITFNQDLGTLQELSKGNKAVAEALISLRNYSDSTKRNIKIFEKKISSENDQVITLQFELNELLEKSHKEQHQLEQLSILKFKLSQLNNQFEGNLLDFFDEMLKSADQQFAYYNLEALLINKITKKVQEDFQTWKPNKQNLLLHLDTITKTQLFLRKVFLYKEQFNYQYYAQNIKINEVTELSDDSKREMKRFISYIIQKAILPPLRTYIAKFWKPQAEESDLLIDFFELWKKVIPNEMIDEILDELIVPRLFNAVKDVDLTKETMPIHLWLHPWLVIISDEKMKNIWKIITSKMSQSLQQWNPEDRTAYLLLKPWKKVFDQTQWTQIITRSILPKLIYMLSQFEINPADQDIQPIKYLLEWSSLLNVEQLNMLVETNVMEKMEKVLNEWLAQPGANIGEISLWIKGWKNLLGDIVKQSQMIESYFNTFQAKILIQ